MSRKDRLRSLSTKKSNAVELTKTELKSLYEIYLKRRQPKYEKLKAAGLIYGGTIRKTNFEEFEMSFKSRQAALIDKGKNPTNSQVVTSMIDNELYTQSKLEAARDAKALGINPVVSRMYGGYLKEGDIGQFNMNTVPEEYRKDVETLIAQRQNIIDYDNKLKAQGLGSYERAAEIGRVFFKSPD